MEKPIKKPLKLQSVQAVNPPELVSSTLQIHVSGITGKQPSLVMSLQHLNSHPLATETNARRGIVHNNAEVSEPQETGSKITLVHHKSVQCAYYTRPLWKLGPKYVYKRHVTNFSFVQRYHYVSGLENRD
jgi:hypothetical protein